MITASYSLPDPTFFVRGGQVMTWVYRY